MRYIVIERPGKVLIAEREKPSRKKGEVLLKLLYGGLCGSDLGTYKGTFIYTTYPRIPGHEFSACIEEIDASDERAYGLAKGMAVTALPYFNCGHCYSCERGYFNCCMTNETMGAQRDGAFCEYITMPARMVYDGKGLDHRTLAMIEPFCISYHAIQKAKVAKGENVLVLGGGPIGQLALLAARLRGAEVTVADLVDAKLRKALDNGARHAIALDKENFADRVREITGGKGFEVCVEAAGAPEALVSAVDAAAFHGRVLVVGVSNRNADLTYSLIQKKELAIFGSRNAMHEDFIGLIGLLKNDAEIERSVASLITAELPFDEAQQAFQQSVDPTMFNIKTMLRF